jgi:hypothetical protein
MQPLAAVRTRYRQIQWGGRGEGGVVPFCGGSAAARQRAPPRMHSKPYQPPTTPCLYLVSPAWCTSYFVVV